MTSPIPPPRISLLIAVVKAHLYPLDTVGAPHGVDNRVEAVAHNAVDLADPCGHQFAQS